MEVERYMAQTAAVSYPTSPDWYHMFSHNKNIYKCLKMPKLQFYDIIFTFNGSFNFYQNNMTTSAPVAGHCYRHRCTGINKYQIQVMDSDWLDCPAGKNIEVSEKLIGIRVMI